MICERRIQKISRFKIYYTNSYAYAYMLWNHRESRTSRAHSRFVDSYCFSPPPHNPPPLYTTVVSIFVISIILISIPTIIVIVVVPVVSRGTNAYARFELSLRSGSVKMYILPVFPIGFPYPCLLKNLSLQSHLNDTIVCHNANGVNYSGAEVTHRILRCGTLRARQIKIIFMKFHASSDVAA